MYARFKVSADTGDASGQRGLIETINTLATASAGATISAPTGTSYFQLVNNTEAGGHTIQGTANGASYGTGSGLQQSNYASIESNTPKNGTNYKKRFELKFTGSNAHYAGSVRPVMTLMDGSSTRMSVSLTYNNISSSASGTNQEYWWYRGSNYAATDFLWHFSVTEKYAWIWYETLGDTSTSQFSGHYAGVADLKGTPSWKLETGNAYFPAVGFYSGNVNGSQYYGTSSTSHYRDYFAHSIQGTYIQSNDTANDYYNAGAVQYTKEDNQAYYNFSNDAPLRFGLATYYNAPGANAVNVVPKTTFDGNGDRAGVLTPIFYFNPANGIPYQTVEGIYNYTPYNVYSGSQGQNSWTNVRQSEIIYDDAGDKYSVLYHKGQHHSKAFRVE